jgi:hypothetical protein
MDRCRKGRWYTVRTLWDNRGGSGEGEGDLGKRGRGFGNRAWNTPYGTTTAQ